MAEKGNHLGLRLFSRSGKIPQHTRNLPAHPDKRDLVVKLHHAIQLLVCVPDRRRVLGVFCSTVRFLLSVPSRCLTSQMYRAIRPESLVLSSHRTEARCLGARIDFQSGYKALRRSFGIDPYKSSDEDESFPCRGDQTEFDGLDLLYAISTSFGKISSFQKPHELLLLFKARLDHDPVALLMA